jgi:probable F420-dependent oxidoreductase
MRYLDELDRGDPPVPADERVLGALGPKMLDLARARSAGAHPYLVTPDHTALARGALGDDRLLAPNQMIVLSSAPSAARAIARQYLAIYLGLPNYTNNLRRLGFGDEDLAPPGSDRLVDALVVWGKIDEIVSRSKAHIDAGADHVVLQVLTEDSRSFPRNEWRELADGLALVD